MSRQLYWLLFFLAALLLLIVAAEILHRRFRWPPERSRKFLHVSGGLMCLLFPLIFSSHWYVLILSTLAFALLLITYKAKMLSSVHQTKRYSLGSILFPIPVYGCFLAAELRGDSLLFYLPVSLLAISDTAAEIGGHQWGHMGKQFFNKQKTLAGTACFFVTAILVSGAWLYTGYQLTFISLLSTTLLMAALTALAELLTLHGWDNISVPATAVILLVLIRQLG